MVTCTGIRINYSGKDYRCFAERLINSLVGFTNKNLKLRQWGKMQEHDVKLKILTWCGCTLAIYDMIAVNLFHIL